MTKRLLQASLAAGLVGLSVLVPVQPSGAAETVGSDLVTTDSTVTVAWGDQPRVAADTDDATTVARLRDWKLRVSQTRDLLNQTVQVSWTGAVNNSGNFLQLMQCWSDGPTVKPTREQCAYGGISGAEDSGSTGLARNRRLGDDPREKTYLDNGSLGLVSVDGAVFARTWSAAAKVVLGTSAGRTCPTATTGHNVALVPPRSVVAAGTLPASLVLKPQTAGAPAGLARPTSSGGTQKFGVVTPEISTASVAADRSLATLPLGIYRVQVSCTGTADAEIGRFTGFLEHVEIAGAKVWRLVAKGGVSVPFDPLGDSADTIPTDPYNPEEVLEYVKPRTTNEVWQAKVAPDGSGSVFMEVLTDLEAQHLGCGRTESDGRARSCWLVAVPRWAGEPDGTEPSLTFLASPLSQTLWDRRIEVPLSFSPVAAGCEIGSGLKQILADDAALTVLRNWQPAFCDDSATASSVLGPLQDFSIRGSISKPNRFGVLTVPEEGRPTVVTAPLATSGVVIGFAAARQNTTNDFLRNGTRASLMNLNARLVAKLLSQSYDSGAAPNGGKESGYNGDNLGTETPARKFPASNPRNLYTDPEFLALNPDFATWIEGNAIVPIDVMGELLVSASDTDAYNALFRWILADKAAAAFLAGAPDPAGMRVNPYYKNAFTETQSSFPLLDPTCADRILDPEGDGFPLLCQLNLHPRVENDTQAAQAAVRGDTKRFNGLPQQFVKNAADQTYRAEARQESSRAAMMVVTTSAVAERFGLPTARLKNASGSFVGATSASLAAARSQMTRRSDGVLLSNPGAVTGAGYPLTVMSYAAADVATITADQRAAFAKIFDYAAGPGQVSGRALGQLPPGYAPLDATLKAQTIKAAALLRDPSSLLPAVPSEPAEPGEPNAPTEPEPQAPVAAPGGITGPGLGVGNAPGVVTDPVVAGGTKPPVVSVLPAGFLPAAGAARLALVLPLLALLAVLAAAGARASSLLRRSPV